MAENADKTQSTIFDDVFRTMEEKMPQLMIPVINEVFATAYSENEKVEHFQNEHQTKEGKIITDSCFGIRNHLYHVECQSNVDYAMTVRMIEYDFSIALHGVKKKKRGIGDVMGGKILELPSDRLLAEGESRLGKLINILLNEGRMDDIRLVATNEEARKEFYKKYGIID